MIVATLFGTNNGLEVKNLAVGETPPISIEDEWLAYFEQDVKLKTDGDLIRFNRRVIDGKTLTWMGLYRELAATNPHDQTGYYGVGLWIYDAVVPGLLVAEALVNLADQVKNLALSDGQFVKKIGDILTSIVAPAQLMALAKNKGAVIAGLSPNGAYKAFLSTQSNPASSLLDWAQRSRTAEAFNQVLIGRPDHYVAQPGTSKTERFDSVTGAVEWAYSMRISSLDEIVNKQAKELEGVKKGAGQAYAALESAELSYQGDRNRVVELEKENEVLRNEFEKARKKIAAQGSVYGQTSAGRKPFKSTGAKGFVSKNAPFLLLIFVLMAGLVMFAMLWQSAHLKNTAYLNETASLIEAQKELRKQKAESDRAYIELANELKQIKNQAQAK